MRIRFLSMGLTVAALATAVLAACGDAGVEPRAGQDYPQLPADYVLGDITHYMTQDGIRRVMLRADSGYFYADSMRANLVNVHMLLYNETGQEVADLTSKTGQLDQRTNAMIARGNVVLVAKGGSADRVETQELHYDPNEHRIWSDVASTIWQNGAPTQTNGFSTDDQMRNIQMKGVRGKVQANKVTF